MTFTIRIILVLWGFMTLGDMAQAATYPVNQCPADRYGANLNCTANDVRFAGSPEVLAINGVPGATTCPAGTQVSMDVRFTLETAPNTRYNIGLYVGNDAKDIKLESSSGGNASCSSFSFPNNAEGFQNLDGNVCGDVSDGPETLTPIVNNVILDCTPNASGKVSVPAALSWEQNAGNANSCLGPQSIVPGTSSKCSASAGNGLEIPITSLATLTINKVAYGGGSTGFSFTATGTSGGNSAIPSPESFVLNDGESQIITIPYGSGPAASLSVTEAETAGWLLRSLRCDDGQGNPVSFVTIDKKNGQLVANFDATHTSATCTYTNITLPINIADLAVTKTVSNMSPAVGEEVTFTVTATNNGPSAATGVTVEDTLPDGYTLVSASPSKGSVANGLWTIGDLAKDENATLEISAIVKILGVYTNTATVSGDVIDPNPENDISTVTPVPKVTDLAVVKTVNNPTPDVGQNVIFTITATNNGPSAATGVRVTDSLPAGYTFVSAVASQGSIAANVWEAGNLANGASARLDVTATVNATGPFLNTAIISGNEIDSKPINNISRATTVPSSVADLAVNKTVNNPAPTVGQNVIFTITVTNNGPSAASGVTVTDSLPSGFAFVAAQASKGSLSGNIWAIGDLANGENATLMIMARVNSAGTYTNTATVSGNETDPAPGNNTSIITTEPDPQADLAVTKTVSNPTPVVGDSVTFTITVLNNGPSEATGVTVADALPSGYTLVSLTPSQGTVAGGVWTVGNLASGASATLTVVATVNATGFYTNTATVSGNQPDPEPGNNTITITPTIPPTPDPKADLSVTKTVSNPTPVVGDSVTFTITVLNNGPSEATGVTVADALPSGYTLVSLTPSQGTVAGGVWTVGNLASGASATLQIVATVNATGFYSNTATVSGNQPDPEPGNNTISITPAPIRMANLMVNKTVDNPTPTVGENVTFTITVTNNGPAVAAGVILADTLPSGYTLVSATPSKGTLSGGFWTIGILTPGASATLEVVAQVKGSGVYVNTATVSGNQPDPDPGDNTSSITPIPKPQKPIPTSIPTLSNWGLIMLVLVLGVVGLRPARRPV